MSAIRLYFKELRSIISNELRTIFQDEGVLLIVVFAPLIYATIYSFAYSTQVLRDVPVGIIDMSHTPSSRHLIQMIDIGPNTMVAYEAIDMEEARRLFYDRKIYSILYIPADYEQNILGGKSANVAIYLDASYMLMYRQAFEEMAASISAIGAKVEFNHLIAEGANIPQAITVTEPIIYQSHTLFNPYLGYGTFVMPPVMMLILQQTLLIGIGMIGGTWRENRLYKKLIPQGCARLHTFPIIFGRSIVYFAIYSLLLYYLLHVHYKIFNYPMNGTIGAIILFLAIYLFSCILFALAISTIFRRRESSLMFLLWSSIPLLMMSGVSYPHEAMPEWLRYLSNIFPSTFGTMGFVKIATKGASIYEVLPEIRSLTILIVIYLVFACLSVSRLCHNACTINEMPPQPPSTDS